MACAGLSSQPNPHSRHGSPYRSAPHFSTTTHPTAIGDHGTVSDAPCQIRRAGPGDAEAVADLAAGLAQSFPFSRARFDLSYPALLATGEACLLLAVTGEEPL